MINFSKVARALFGQPLKEEPMVDGEFVPAAAPQRQQRRETPPIVRRGGGNNVGAGGHNLENQVAQNLLPQIYPDGNFNHVDSVVGGQQAASIKTDIFDDAGTGDEQDNINYSVKMKRDNDKPVKIHQTGKGRGAAGLFSKLAIPYGSRPSLQNKGEFADSLRNNPLNQALIMLYGSPHGGMNKMRDLFGATGSQRDFLRQFDSNEGDQERIKSNPFVTSGELEENFPQQFQALMDHMNENREGIFNNLVRMSGRRSNYYGNYGYADGSDAAPVSRLITHKLNGSRGARNAMNGTTSIHDISDDAVREAMENMEWRQDGNGLYLADQELTSADGDKKLLDMYPINEENSRWAVLPQGDDAPTRGQRGFFDGLRGSGIVEPGHFKATMGTDDEFMDKNFPKIWSGELDGGNWTGDFVN